MSGRPSRCDRNRLSIGSRESEWFEGSPQARNGRINLRRLQFARTGNPFVIGKANDGRDFFSWIWYLAARIYDWDDELIISHWAFYEEWVQIPTCDELGNCPTSGGNGNPVGGNGGSAGGNGGTTGGGGGGGTDMTSPAPTPPPPPAPAIAMRAAGGGMFAGAALGVSAAAAGISNGAGQLAQEEERRWGSYLPGAEAGDRAAQYWADRLVAAGGNFTDAPVAATGLLLSVLWTDETAANTAFTLGTAGTGSLIKGAAGPLGQWIRIGPSYSKAAGQNIGLSVRWGASPAGGGKYIQQIPSPTLQRFNQWLRGLRPPGRDWRTQDSGHLHIKK